MGYTGWSLYARICKDKFGYSIKEYTNDKGSATKNLGNADEAEARKALEKVIRDAAQYDDVKYKKVS